MATSPSVAIRLEEKQQEAVVKYCTNCVDTLSSVWNLREQFLLKDLHYYRETDRSEEQRRAIQANNSGDVKKIQNMQVPVVMPQTESALAYLSGVFLSGYPIFGIAADPLNIDKALQMETVVADNSIQYGWVRHLILFLRDTLKYNLGAMEVTWKKKRVYSLELDPGKRDAKKTEVFYEGNCLHRLDPYNTIWDKRVHPAKIHTDGEFAGYTEIMSRIQLKQLMLDLNSEFTMNGKKAFESGTPNITLGGADAWYYTPQINPLAFIGANQSFPSTNWMNWAMIDGSSGKEGIQYHDVYEVTTIYGRIIPNDFRMPVPMRNQPQIWKFILVNRKVLIYVERQTNAHNNLPILFGQANEDGLGYQTKSFGDNAIPFQSMSSALWNSAIASQRRKVYDRIYYDPSRIRKEDIDKVTEVARIPVKQSAYGKAIGDAVHESPYRDEGMASTLQMAETISALADIANGQNKVQRGQFQKGNKSRREFEETMSSANSRQQLQALSLEHQFFVPLKETIKINILQYQGDMEIYNANTKAPVKVKQAELRAASLQFKVSDGILPTEKLLSTDLLQVFMQTIQTSPLMQSEFDIVGAFIYWCKAQGAQWLDDFKRSPEQSKQVMQQLAAYAQAENTRPQVQPGAPAPGGNGATA